MRPSLRSEKNIALAWRRRGAREPQRFRPHPGPSQERLLGPVTASADFTITATSASLTVNRGSTGTYTVTITQVNGPSTVNLSGRGLPGGTSGTFNLSAVASSSRGTTSALKVSVSSSATKSRRLRCEEATVISDTHNQYRLRSTEMGLSHLGIGKMRVRRIHAAVTRIRPPLRLWDLWWMTISKSHVHPLGKDLRREMPPCFSGRCDVVPVFCAYLPAPSRWAELLANGYPRPAANHGRQDSAGGMCRATTPPCLIFILL